MNRARIRPPYPLFRWVAGLAAVPVVWGTMHFALDRMPTLAKVYWSDYLKASYMPDLEGVKHVKPFGKTAQLPAPPRKILCQCPPSMCKPGAVYVWPPPKSLAVTDEPVPPLEKLRWVKFISGWDRAKERAQYVAWLRDNIYGGAPASVFLFTPLAIGWGLAALFFAFAWYLDYERQIRFRNSDRLLRGPILVSPRQFNKTVKGPCVEIELERSGLAKITQPKTLKIPRDALCKHTEAIGAGGSGKTVLLKNIAEDSERRGRREVVTIYYDPHLQFTRWFCDLSMGDMILGPLDARSARWNPASEVDYTNTATAQATALAQGASLYPGNPTRRDWFFTNAARIIWQYAMVHYRPTADQLVELLTHADPLLDAIAVGTELEEMLKKNAEGQRAGIISTVTSVLFALRQIPSSADEDIPEFSARRWARERPGNLFITSRPETQEAVGPLLRLWIDSLLMNLLAVGKRADLPQVRIILDELANLGELGKLKDVMTQARKAGLEIYLGFQDPSQIQALYHEESRAVISAPVLRYFGRIADDASAKQVSAMIAQAEVETVTQHRAPDADVSFTSNEKVKDLVMAGELGSLEDRTGFIRYGNYCVDIRGKLKLGLGPRRAEKAVGFVPMAGEAPQQLPLPDLATVRAKEAEQRANDAAKAAGGVWPAKGAAR
jgi:hypothetical protein